MTCNLFNIQSWMAASLVDCMCVWLGLGFGLGIWYGRMVARLVACLCACEFAHLGQ